MDSRTLRQSLALNLPIQPDAFYARCPVSNYASPAQAFATSPTFAYSPTTSIAVRAEFLGSSVELMCYSSPTASNFSVVKNEPQEMHWTPNSAMPDFTSTQYCSPHVHHMFHPQTNSTHAAYFVPQESSLQRTGMESNERFFASMQQGMQSLAIAPKPEFCHETQVRRTANIAEKQEARRRRNREAANRFRKRRADRITELEQELEQLRRANEARSLLVETLRCKAVQLKAECEAYDIPDPGPNL